MELKGKVINFLGDSITEGVGVNDIKNRYDNRLKEILGLEKVNNYGIGGTRIAHQSNPSDNPRFDMCFCSRAYDMDKSADVIVVYGGVNDYMHGDAPFGVMTDSTPETFCGGVDFLMRFLKSEYKNSVIVFMTPAHENYGDINELKPSPHPWKLPDAKPLKDYRDVIIKKGEQYGIYVLDLSENLAIDPNCEEQKKKYTADGLHFNDNGHAVIAEVLANYLRNI